jgi:hypothetical protein
MNALAAASEGLLVRPARPRSSHEACQLSVDQEPELKFESVQLRAETITSVLEDILHGKFISPRWNGEPED